MTTSKKEDKRPSDASDKQLPAHGHQIDKDLPTLLTRRVDTLAILQNPSSREVTTALPSHVSILIESFFQGGHHSYSQP